MRLLLVLFAILAGGTAAGETYHVAPPPTGSDSATGLSGSPWATLQHAADELEAGDTVIVAAGTYVGFYLSTGGNGESDRVVFQAEPGAVVNTDNPTNDNGINVENADYVTITGFTVTGATRAGIRCALSNHVHVIGNTATANGRWGIFSGFCDDFLVENNDCSGSIDEHGVYVSNSADRPVVRGNILWSNNANGLHMNGDESMGGDGIIEDALVENNIIFDNGVGGGSGINCDGCQRAVIQNNLLYDSHSSGISLYDIDAAEGSKDNLVINNTVLVASDGRWALNIQDASTNNTALNNILLSDHSWRGSISISADSLTGFVSDYNVVMDRFTTDGGDNVLSLAGWRTNTSQGSQSRTSTIAAEFVGGGDYHLSENSQARNHGTSTQAPAADLDGRTRPLESVIDIGAYEYCPPPCAESDGGPADDGAPADGAPGDGTAPAGDPDGSASPGTVESGCSCAASAAPAAVFVLLALRRRFRRTARSSV